jgi:hypothetical protein
VHILAHQGGWDEILWFAGPIIVVMLWVRWAERKARSRARDIAGAGNDATSTLPPHDLDH